jgi:citrate synthase
MFPDGDPRARALAEAVRYADGLVEIAAAAEAVTGQAANLDYALVAAARTLGLPADAPATILMVARTAGWLGHALEQRVSGSALGVRARYEDPDEGADAANAA